MCGACVCVWGGGGGGGGGWVWECGKGSSCRVEWSAGEQFTSTVVITLTLYTSPL